MEDDVLSLRRYQDGDHLVIGEIFYRAVHQLACADYSKEQVEAWAPYPIDFDCWKLRCIEKQPFVAVKKNRVIGFIELDPDGHIDCVYVDPDHAGTGVMSALMRRVKQDAREAGVALLFAEVSLTARRFFETHGFAVVRANRVVRDRVSLENFIMHCDISIEAGTG